MEELLLLNTDPPHSNRNIYCLICDNRSCSGSGSCVNCRYETDVLWWGRRSLHITIRQFHTTSWALQRRLYLAHFFHLSFDYSYSLECCWSLWGVFFVESKQWSIFTEIRAELLVRLWRIAKMHYVHPISSTVTSSFLPTTRTGSVGGIVQTIQRFGACILGWKSLSGQLSE